MIKLNTNRGLHITLFSIMTVGGINWGLIGLFDLNLVNLIFGGLPGIERLIYIIVGVSTVYIFATHRRDCRICGAVGATRQT